MDVLEDIIDKEIRGKVSRYDMALNLGQCVINLLGEENFADEFENVTGIRAKPVDIRSLLIHVVYDSEDIGRIMDVDENRQCNGEDVCDSEED